MEQKIRFYTEQTLKSWDQAAEVHERRNPELINRVSENTYNGLEPDFNRLMDSQDITGKSVVQVCCNNGKDLISIKNKGAGYCLGIDGSSKFVEQARALANASPLSDLQFEHHNIYALPDSYNNTFDFAVVTVGVLAWMPRVTEFFSIVSALLKPGGTLLMEEIHPVLNMYEEGNPSSLAYSYFDRSAQREEGGLDYFAGEKYESAENYCFQHTFSDILMAAISADFSLQYIEELSANVGNYCADLEATPANPPLAFIAKWKKAHE